mmetsp:Transcript_10419/g.38692  ORF Transcript_10419/g.38692 Transcript_10419/m.38692 type:complete len:948 (-) Transcript_10419:1928-4771(-)
MTSQRWLQFQQNHSFLPEEQACTTTRTSPSTRQQQFAPGSSVHSSTCVPAGEVSTTAHIDSRVQSRNHPQPSTAAQRQHRDDGAQDTRTRTTIKRPREFGFGSTLSPSGDNSPHHHSTFGPKRRKLSVPEVFPTGAASMSAQEHGAQVLLHRRQDGEPASLCQITANEQHSTITVGCATSDFMGQVRQHRAPQHFHRTEADENTARVLGSILRGRPGIDEHDHEEAKQRLQHGMASLPSFLVTQQHTDAAHNISPNDTMTGNNSSTPAAPSQANSSIPYDSASLWAMKEEYDRRQQVALQTQDDRIFSSTGSYATPFEVQENFGDTHRHSSSTSPKEHLHNGESAAFVTEEVPSSAKLISSLGPSSTIAPQHLSFASDESPRTNSGSDTSTPHSWNGTGSEQWSLYGDGAAKEHDFSSKGNNPMSVSSDRYPSGGLHLHSKMSSFPHENSTFSAGKLASVRQESEGGSPEPFLQQRLDQQRRYQHSHAEPKHPFVFQQHFPHHVLVQQSGNQFSNAGGNAPSTVQAGSDTTHFVSGPQQYYFSPHMQLRHTSTTSPPPDTAPQRHSQQSFSTHPLSAHRPPRWIEESSGNVHYSPSTVEYSESSSHHLFHPPVVPSPPVLSPGTHFRSHPPTLHHLHNMPRAQMQNLSHSSTMYNGFSSTTSASPSTGEFSPGVVVGHQHRVPFSNNSQLTIAESQRSSSLHRGSTRTLQQPASSVFSTSTSASLSHKEHFIEESILSSFTSKAKLSIRDSNKLLDVRQDKVFKISFLVGSNKDLRFHEWELSQDKISTGDSCYVEYLGVRFRKHDSRPSTAWRASEEKEQFTKRNFVPRGPKLLDIIFKLPKTQHQYCGKSIGNHLQFIFRLHFLPKGVKPSDCAKNPPKVGCFTDVGVSFVCATKKKGKEFSKVDKVSSSEAQPVLSVTNFVPFCKAHFIEIEEGVVKSSHILEE